MQACPTGYYYGIVGTLSLLSLYDGNRRFYELTEIIKLQKKLRAREVDSEDIPRYNVSG